MTSCPVTRSVMWTIRILYDTAMGRRFWWLCGNVLDLRWQGPGFKSHPRRLHGLPTPSQRVIPPTLVVEYHWKLGSKRAYHAIQQPHVRGLAASAGVRLKANVTEISAVLWALEAREHFTFTLFTLLHSYWSSTVHATKSNLSSWRHQWNVFCHKTTVNEGRKYWCNI